MRKVHVTVKVDLLINMDEGIDVHDVIWDLDYSFNSQTDGADIEDSHINDYEVTDSR
jgi:hypothetical protein